MKTYRSIQITLVTLSVLAVAAFFASQRAFAQTDPFATLKTALLDETAYTYSAAVEQTLIPRPVPQNIGKSSDRVDTQITGEVEGDFSKMTLLAEGAGVNTQPLLLEQDGFDTWVVLDGERTLIDNPMSGSVPGGQFLGYLDSAENITQLAENRRFTTYTFDINGETLAQNLRDQQQAALQPPLDRKTTLQVSPALSRITGSGEVWIDNKTGLPLRQILHINFPEINDLYDSQSEITIDFAFDTSATPLDDMLIGNWQLVVDHWQLTSTLTLVLTISGATFLLFALPPRRRRLILTTAIAATMLLTPILDAVSLFTVETVHAAPESLHEALGLPEPQQAAPATVDRATASTALECGDGAKGTDTDNDGLDDFTEICYGTDPYYEDTDRDLIPDYDEIIGITHAGETWHSNPFLPDSNSDGMADYNEWIAPHGTAPDIDPDGDNIPNLWDDDNDGDGLRDNVDLDPFTVTAYQNSYSLQTSRGSEAFDGYQYIEFQVQPEDESHLRFNVSALDWPYDEEGDLQDLDNSTDDLSLTPMLKIETNNAPSSDLQDEYGLSVGGSNGDFVMYVPLTAVGEGGQIAAFSGKVVYGSGDLNDINWENITMVWMGTMANDSYSGNDVKTNTAAIVEYEEAAWRFCGVAGVEIGRNAIRHLRHPQHPD